ncbi:fungal-specific transcription factor domain-containing protein [Sodiomyces alkalinus F11]|uniref:Fungal-specific transcription factor domain-containing protein n=1 Tax=Sodiomyces alkalinus (strain CBS 110278 / VKM F-3762 / F11) TaxID=1314773 RepID=A0A3N2PSB4_SODAK|nr:fungal-specific transcription factor domain-containing protein [Sodiomyces alkalinus F11]ROT37403.1 fungal-specific transcription factor domain-containing protein [Sodiomyces alkalinus F11]
MAPTPPETSSSGRSPEEQYRVVRKRNRVPLSCYPCRTRKKCDRNHPCSNCMKREGGDANSCHYATPVTRKKNQNQGSSSPDDMQNRIDRLEGLVLSLMHGGANISPSSAAVAATASSSGKSTTPPQRVRMTTDSVSSSKCDRDDEAGMNDDNDDDSDVDGGLATSLGILKFDPNQGKSMYIGQEHWHLILTDIAEVKNYFNTHKTELEKSYEKVRLSKPPSAMEGPTILLGAPRATAQELRDGLPSRASVFTLCGRYFSSMDTGTYAVHGPTFQRELRAYWEDPSKPSIMWLGLLYAILTLAMLSYNRVGDEPPEWKGRTLEMAAEYRLRTAQCLVEGDYTKPGEYTVETMLLYVYGEYSSRWDADLGLWMISSLITRIALRLGYHRDAKWFPSLTPFQAEMRRRMWIFIRVTDIMFSHNVSLPSMIRDEDCDTQFPSNLFDDEFGPDINELPPSRPNIEPTPISYMIAKTKLCLELGRILQLTGRVDRPAHYEEILRFDARLREFMQDLPPHLKIRPLEGSHDPVSLIMARFNIDVLYQKIMCILHRRYLSRARQNIRYAHSRRAAVEASLEILQHLATLHRESRPSGRLQSIQWHVTSIATKDSMLPAMVVAMDLHHDNVEKARGERRTPDESFFWTTEQRLNMIEHLELTKNVFQGLADTSVEAYKAYTGLNIMLQKIRLPDPSSESPNGGVNMSGYSDPQSEIKPEHSAAMTLGLLSSGMTPDTAAALASMQTLGPNGFGDVDFSMSTDGPGTGLTPNVPVDLGMNNPQSPFSMFTNLESSGDLMANFDWTAFENYTQSANWGTDNSFTLFPGDATQPQPDQDGSGYSFPNSARASSR